MSRTNLTTWESFELKFDCDQCGAIAGQWCRTKGNKWAGYPHAERYYAAKKEQERRQRDRTAR
jgi:hypothetical protein